METAEWYDDRTTLPFMGLVLSALSGQTSAADPYARMVLLTMLHQRSSRINYQEVVLHRALARLDKIHSASSISRAASTFRSFGIQKPTVRGSLVSLVDRPLWRSGIVSGASFVKETEP